MLLPNRIACKSVQGGFPLGAASCMGILSEILKEMTKEVLKEAKLFFDVETFPVIHFRLLYILFIYDSKFDFF